MITAIVHFLKAISEWGDYTQRKFVENATQLCYWPQLFLVLAVFGIPWIYAWNMHVIGPWVDNLIGLGPHDIDSYGKVIWRRIWSSAVCAPFVTYALIRFAVNRYKLNRDTKPSKTVR